MSEPSTAMLREDESPQERHERRLDLAERVYQMRIHFYSRLIDTVEEDRYPSIQTMDLIEEGLPEELYDRYVGILAEKVDADRFPSLYLVRRLQRVVGF